MEVREVVSKKVELYRRRELNVQRKKEGLRGILAVCGPFSTLWGGRAKLQGPL